MEWKKWEFADRRVLLYIASLDELVRHGLLALRDTLQQDKELTIQNTSLGIVGKDKDFHIIEDEALQRYLDLLGDETRSRRGGASGRSAAESIAAESSREDNNTEIDRGDVAPMETDN